jgi:hypothetical protein
LAAAAPAQAATSYPDGGSDFAVDAQGWIGSDASCSGGVVLVCTASNEYEPGAGNPPGSLTTRVDATVNPVGTFEGSGTWTSPAFTVPAGEAVTGATFVYDRQLAAGGPVNLGPQSTVTVQLVDETAGSPITLLTESLTDANATFATHGVGVPPSALVPGHSYRLRIATHTTATVAGVGVLDTRFDNVALAVERGGGAGATTPIVSPGVRVIRGSYSTSEINALFKRVDERTQVGQGPGGSLIPLKDCTIIGTAGADRITGTLGNEVICGLGGNDVIDGAGGIDIIDGANGRDRLRGGARKDKLIALRGNDRLNGGRGNDRAGGGAGRDRVSGASGADRLVGGRGRDRILAGAGKDRIAARDGKRDRVDGGKGFDRARVDLPARGTRPTRAALRRVDKVRRVERRR